MRPNPWILFMVRISGQGLSMAQVSSSCGEWKRDWLRDNPGLSPTATKARMNATLCEEVAEANGLARARTPAAVLAQSRDERQIYAGPSEGAFFFLRRKSSACLLLCSVTATIAVRLYVCVFAAFVSNNKRITFSQRDIPKMRAIIAWSILHKRL